VRVAQSGTRRDLVAAALATGLAAGTKYNGGLVALPVLYAVIISPKRTSRQSRVRDAAIAVALMVAAFLCTSPYTMFEFSRFWADFADDALHLSGGHGIDLGRGWIYHATTTLRYGVGVPLLVAGLAGMGLLMVKDRRAGVLVALFPVS